MGYIKYDDRPKVGDTVITTIEHEYLSGKFEIGTIVRIFKDDPMRGFSIVDEDGNVVNEIGWVV